MDPIFSILKYYLSKKGISNDDESIDSFFENGLSFPNFISIIFNIDTIPKINSNPRNLFHKKINNDIAFNFLCQKIDFFRISNTSYDTTHARTNLIVLILTKLCFTMSTKEIIKTSNIILQKNEYEVKNISDLMNTSFFILILNALSDHKIELINDKDLNIMKKNFEVAKVPLFINLNSIRTENQDILLIQVKFQMNQIIILLLYQPLMKTLLIMVIMVSLTKKIILKSKMKKNIRMKFKMKTKKILPIS